MHYRYAAVPARFEYFILLPPPLPQVVAAADKNGNYTTAAGCQSHLDHWAESPRLTHTDGFTVLWLVERNFTVLVVVRDLHLRAPMTGVATLIQRSP